MSDDKVLGVDFLPPPAPSAGQVNVTADGLSDLQRESLTDGQLAALRLPTQVDPRSPLVDEPNAVVPGDELGDGDLFFADDYSEEHPHSHLGGPDLGDDPDGDVEGYDGRVDEPIEATEGHGATVLDDMGPEPKLDEQA